MSRVWYYNACVLLTLHTLIMALSLWTLSCTVSMTTTQGRLLVTCVGGFACTEWELHNRLSTERVFGSAQQFELRMKFMNLVMEQLQSMWWKMVRWLHFFFVQAVISHINTLRSWCGSHCSPNPEILSCGWSSQLGTKKKCLWHVPSSWWSHHGIFLQTPSPLSFCLREKIPPSCVERPLGWTGKASHGMTDLPCWSHLFCYPTQQRCILMASQERLNTEKICQTIYLA